MDFKQAEQFLAVVEFGGIGRAADALRCAEPSLSRAIQVLEREMKAPLFHRAGRGLVPTIAGEALVEPARRLLRDVATARALVAEVAGINAGTLDIAGAGGPLELLLPIVGTFRQRFPDVRVRIQTPAMESQLLKDVRQGSSELGLLPLPPTAAEPDEAHQATGLSITWLGAERLKLVLPPGTDPAVPDPVPLDELPDLPVVAAPIGAHGRDVVETALRRAKVRTVLAVATGHRATQYALVQRGLGLAFIPEGQIGLEQTGGVIVRDVEPDISLPYGVVHRPGYISPHARAFIDLAHSRPSRS